MSDDDGKRIRERAYHLWEEAGRPPGRALEHWTEAERQLEREIASSGGEDNSPAAPAPTPRPRKAKEAPEKPGPDKAKKTGRSRNESSVDR